MACAERSPRALPIGHCIVPNDSLRLTSCCETIGQSSPMEERQTLSDLTFQHVFEVAHEWGLER
jgi:hypothetical protein